MFRSRGLLATSSSSTAAVAAITGSQSFIQRAVESAKVFEQARRVQAEVDAEEHEADRYERDGRSSTGRLVNTGDKPLSVPRYRDDKAAGRRAKERLYKSPAYRELHSHYVGNSGLGGYGGEAGFEVAPRMYVDPDRPHTKAMFNSTALLSNIKYARFGHFVKELHMIDIDKMYRFARMVPPPTKLLAVLTTNRVALPDRSCAALIRQMGRIMADASSQRERDVLLAEAKELFERLLVQNLPPADVGVQTHAELLKCAAIAKDWSLGWDAVHQRAVSEMTANPDNFMLTSDYFEAAIGLCRSCYKVEEGLQTFEQLLAINLRPTQETIDIMMDMLTQSVTIKLDGQFNDDAETLYGSASKTSLGGMSLDLADDVSANGRRFQKDADEAVLGGSTASLLIDAAVTLGEESLTKIMARADELWTLYEYFDYKPTTISFRNYVKVLAAIGQSDRLLAAREHARQKGIVMDEETYLWFIYGLRHVRGAGTLISEMVLQMKAAALNVSVAHHQLALMAFALQKDGASAAEYAETHMVPAFDWHRDGLSEELSIEMCLYTMLAMAVSNSLTPSRRPTTGGLAGTFASANRAAAAASASPATAYGGSVTGSNSDVVTGATLSPNTAPVTLASRRIGKISEAYEVTAEYGPRRMVQLAGGLMRFMENYHSAFDCKASIYEAYFMLCGRAGESVVEAHSMLKKAMSEGVDLTPRILNHVLLANANSPTTGSRLITEEVTQMLLVVPQLHATAETFVALEHCKEAHGITALTDEMWDRLLGEAITLGQAAMEPEDRVDPRQIGKEGGEAPTSKDAAEGLLPDSVAADLLESIAHDAPIAVPLVPIHALRKHAVAVNIRAYDVGLARHGQYVKDKFINNRIAYGSMTKPKEAFGHRGAMEVNL